MGPHVDGDFTDIPKATLYANVEQSGVYIDPIVEIMIAGIRSLPTVVDPRVIDLAYDPRINGTGDVCSEANRILRALLHRKRNPEETLAHAQKIWESITKTQLEPDVFAKGLKSFERNENLFLHLAYQWWDTNPMVPSCRREHGDVTFYSRVNGALNPYDIPMNGKWVVRNQHGSYIDNSNYRNDLLFRYPGLEIIGN